MTTIEVKTNLSLMDLYQNIRKTCSRISLCEETGSLPAISFYGYENTDFEIDIVYSDGCVRFKGITTKSTYSSEELEAIAIKVLNNIV